MCVQFFFPFNIVNHITPMAPTITNLKQDKELKTQVEMMKTIFATSICVFSSLSCFKLLEPLE